MYLQHFGLRPRHWERKPPNSGMMALWRNWPSVSTGLQSPGIGLITGEPGVGKTAALRNLTKALNPHRYQLIYQAETDFGRIDIYRGLARALGIEPAYRRAQLWRDIKERIHELAQTV